MKEEMYEIAIRKLTEAFDDFIGSCIDKDGNPKTPPTKELFRARGCLPEWCKNTLIVKKEREHNTGSPDCWCNPEIKQVSNGLVIVHNYPEAIK